MRSRLLKLIRSIGEKTLAVQRHRGNLPPQNPIIDRRARSDSRTVLKGICHGHPTFYPAHFAY
jgi:hypothetical protein